MSSERNLVISSSIFRISASKRSRMLLNSESITLKSPNLIGMSRLTPVLCAIYILACTKKLINNGREYYSEGQYSIIIHDGNNNTRCYIIITTHKLLCDVIQKWLTESVFRRRVKIGCCRHATNTLGLRLTPAGPHTVYMSGKSNTHHFHADAGRARTRTLRRR